MSVQEAGYVEAQWEEPPSQGGLPHDLWGNRRTRPPEAVPPTLPHGREAGPSPGLLPHRWISLEAARAIKCQLYQRVLIPFADG